MTLPGAEKQQCTGRLKMTRLELVGNHLLVGIQSCLVQHRRAPDLDVRVVDAVPKAVADDLDTARRSHQKARCQCTCRPAPQHRSKPRKADRRE